MAAPTLPSDDELAGLVPQPGSLTWRKAGDLRIISAAGYALLMQVAHPTVGAGVAEHSDFASDPWGRLLRTLDYVNGTIYGGPALAGEIGARVRNLHKSIKGTRPGGERYHALEPRAYAWVHATLASSIVDGHRLLGTPFRPHEAERFWQDWVRLGRLVGVRPRDLPATWAEFGPYFDRIVRDELEDTPTVHVVFDALAKPVPPALPGLHPALWRVLRVPLGTNFQLITKGLLPPVLRERFGFRWSAADEGAFRLMAGASRASRPLVRGPLREFGPFYVRLRRGALARGDVASAGTVAGIRARATGAA